MIIGINSNLLGAFLNAQIGLNTPTLASGSTTPLKPRDPAVITPFDAVDTTNPINQRVAGLRQKAKFILPFADSVLNSNGTDDEKRLFTIFNALNDLSVLAEFAADEKTLSGLRPSLDAKVQGGLTEIRDFLAKTTFDEKNLSVLSGTKSNNVTSKAGLGKKPTEFVTGVVQSGPRANPIASLTGTEKFTINLSGPQGTDNVVIDLALLGGTLNIENIAKFINDEIVKLQVTDPTSGLLVPKYNTRFNVAVLGTDQFGFKAKIGAAEKVTLSAADATPSVIVTGTKLVPGTTEKTKSFVSRLDNLSGVSPTFGFTRDVFASPPEVGVDVPDPTTAPPVDPNAVTVAKVPVAETRAGGVVTDSQGNSYVVGTTKGDFGTQFNRTGGANDVFLSKFDVSGNLVFQRLLGAATDTSAFSVALDSVGNVIIAGQTSAHLNSTDLVNDLDSFVTKFDSAGKELFTHQFTPGATDGAVNVSVDAADNILVSGYVLGQIDTTQTAGGGRDAFFSKLSGVDGTVLATHQFGGTGREEALAVATAADGNILVASKEDGRLFLRKFDATTPSTQIFSLDLGDLQGGSFGGLAVSSSGVFLTGSTGNAAIGGGTVVNAASGGSDGFVIRVDDAGTTASTNFTTFIGGTGNDRARTIAVNGGDVFVAGHTDAGFSGNALNGNQDGFVVKLNGTTGVQQYAQALGAAGATFDAKGISFTTNGLSTLTKLGLPSGLVAPDQSRAVVRQTTVRPGDSFNIRINGGSKFKVTIDATDSFISLAQKIDRLSFLNVTASSLFSSNGPQLKIVSERGATVEILAGPDGRDALKGLGITSRSLIDEVPQTDSQKKATEFQAGGVFGLQLDRALSLQSEKSASFAHNALELAKGIIQQAFRSLNIDPAKEKLKQQLLDNTKKPTGPPPAFLVKQLANLQAGLDRLLGGGGSSTIGFF